MIFPLNSCSCQWHYKLISFIIFHLRRVVSNTEFLAFLSSLAAFGALCISLQSLMLVLLHSWISVNQPRHPHVLVMQKGHLVGKVWKLVFKSVRTNSLKTASLSVTPEKAQTWDWEIWNHFPHLSLAWWDFLCLGYFRCVMKITVLLSLAELRTGLEALWKD